MIHFGEFVQSAHIQVISNEGSKEIIKSWKVENKDFISLPFSAQNGHYSVKLDFNDHEFIKNIVIV
ncbi:MAG: hypothetical protein DRI84_09545 [Bacteroidetes bacterium]|nr:MAG: hypothetical protein DRI84_09545 [Bacteroidota bacterium]